MNRSIIRKAYREAILEVFGCGDKELDAQLVKASKEDIHLGDKAPGQWSPHSILEIYCENGIPNATDINEWGPMPEFGILKGGCHYNSDSWCKVDRIVNLLLEPAYGVKVFHEPYNAAVINIHYA